MRPPIRDVALKAVFLGATTDIVATNIALIPVALAVFASLGQTAMTAPERQAAFSRAFTTSSTIYFAGLVLGAAASVLGGWVAARVARRAEILNGALSAFACVGFGVYGMIKTPGVVPLWQHAAFFVLSPALGAFGGIIRRRQHLAGAASKAGEIPPADVALAPLTGIRRAVYVVNRAMLGLAAILFVLFGIVGLYGYTQHQAAIISGSMIFSGVGVVMALFLLAGARLLRKGHPRHWFFHGGALVMGAIPVILILVSVASRRAG